MRALSERDVAGAEVAERAEGLSNRRMIAKYLRGLLGSKTEHVTDGMTEVAHAERLRLEALAAARRAGRDDVRQKGHFVRDRALSLARRAATAVRRIEREARGVVTENFRLVRRGKEPSDLVPDTEERRRRGSRRSPDGRLVDCYGALEPFRAVEPGVLAGVVGDEAELLAECREEDALNQGALARAAHSCDHDEAAERHPQTHVFQIVLARSGKHELGVAFRHRERLPEKRRLGERDARR